MFATVTKCNVVKLSVNSLTLNSIQVSVFMVFVSIYRMNVNEATCKTDHLIIAMLICLVPFYVYESILYDRMFSMFSGQSYYEPL